MAIKVDPDFSLSLIRSINIYYQRTHHCENSRAWRWSWSTPLTAEPSKGCVSKVRGMATLWPHSLAPRLVPATPRGPFFLQWEGEGPRQASSSFHTGPHFPGGPGRSCFLRIRGTEIYGAWILEIRLKWERRLDIQHLELWPWQTEFTVAPRQNPSQQVCTSREPRWWPHLTRECGV